MAEFQVLHEVGEMNLQQPDVKLTEQEKQNLDESSNKDNARK